MATLGSRLASNGNFYATSQLDELYLINDNFTTGSIIIDNNLFPLQANNLSVLSGYETASSLWTIDMWVYIDSISSGSYQFGIRNHTGTNANNGFYIGVSYIGSTVTATSFNWYNANNSPLLQIFPNNGSTFLGYTKPGWYHFAFQKISTTQIQLYTNGVSRGIANQASASPIAISESFPYSNTYFFSNVGNANSVAPYTRVTGGAALYSSSFTPTFDNTMSNSTVGTTTFIFNPQPTDTPDGGITWNSAWSLGSVYPMAALGTYPTHVFAYKPNIGPNTTYNIAYNNYNTAAKNYANGLFALNNGGQFDEVTFNQKNYNINALYLGTTGSGQGGAYYNFQANNVNFLNNYTSSGSIWTAEMWVYLDYQSTYTQYFSTSRYNDNYPVVYSTPNGNSGINFSLLHYPSGPNIVLQPSVYFFAANNVGASQTFYAPALPANFLTKPVGSAPGWMHVAFQKINSTQIQFYLNGVNLGYANTNPQTVLAIDNSFPYTNSYFQILYSGTNNANLYCGYAKVTGGVNLYPVVQTPSANITPNFNTFLSPSSSGVTNFTLIPRNTDFSPNSITYYSAKQNNLTYPVQLSTSGSNFSSTVFSPNTSYVNYYGSNVAAKMFSNGSFALTSGQFNEVTYNTSSL